MTPNSEQAARRPLCYFGRTKATLAREAILECIDDLEDLYLAESRARLNRKTMSLDEVERELGLAD